MDNNQYPNYNETQQPYGQQVNTGMSQSGSNMNYNQPGYPGQQDYNQQGYPGMQQGFNQQGYPGMQQGFNQQGYPGMQQGFNQQGYPGMQQGFNQQGYPTQQGFNQQGYPDANGLNMQGYGRPKKRLSKGAVIAILSTVLLTIVLAVVLVLVLRPKTGAKTSDEAAKEFIKAWASLDADTMIKYSLPKNLRDDAYDYIKDEYSYYFRNSDNLKEAYQRAYFGRYFDSSDKTQLRNIEVSKDNSYYRGDELSKEIERFFSRYMDSDVDVQDAFEVRVDFEYYDDDYYYNDWDDDYEYFYMYKVKNRWYVFPEDVLD